MKYVVKFKAAKNFINRKAKIRYLAGRVYQTKMNSIQYRNFQQLNRRRGYSDEQNYHIISIKQNSKWKEASMKYKSHRSSGYYSGAECLVNGMSRSLQNRKKSNRPYKDAKKLKL